MKKKNTSYTTFYTTVTVSDFKDTPYIMQLLELAIGIELAFVTKIPNQLRLTGYETDLRALKKELNEFRKYFDQFNIPINNIRIHQPGGYMYYWSQENKMSGFDLLKDFFSYCYTLGFKDYVIHAPYGNSRVDPTVELTTYRENLRSLVPKANVEVEEISASLHTLKDPKLRPYHGGLLEQLMEGQKAHILLDTYECGGAPETISRLAELTSRGFGVKSIHLHRDKHKFLTSNEVTALVRSNFRGNLINEGFLREGHRYEEFIETQSSVYTVPHNQRIEILKAYLETIEVH